MGSGNLCLPFVSRSTAQWRPADHCKDSVSNGYCPVLEYSIIVLRVGMKPVDTWVLWLLATSSVTKYSSSAS